MDYVIKNIRIAGTDEAGRGPLAGPVVASAVILTTEQRALLVNNGLTDSKKLSAKKREVLFDLMQKIGVLWAAQAASAKRIDGTNILRASLWCMGMATLKLSIKPDLLLLDGNKTISGNFPIRQHCVVKGDLRVPVIAAASIIAKVLRDRIMTIYDKLYPLYQFEKHKGYPTKLHYELIKKYGASPIHRLSYKGVL
ncbi:MAG: ribonuclease HII [Synergistaceae bacterium]|nr:ribonuclease HII [Synergistaceae bacterium]